MKHSNLFYANADGSMFCWMEKNGQKYYFRDWGAAFQNEKFEDPNTGEIYYGTSDGSIIMNKESRLMASIIILAKQEQHIRTNLSRRPG